MNDQAPGGAGSTVGVGPQGRPGTLELRIFDNIERRLLPALQEALGASSRGDFCVGYFNLRGWRQIDGFVERWDGTPESCARVLVGMQTLPHEELRAALGLAGEAREEPDMGSAVRLKRKAAEQFREQLTLGAPTNADEAALRRLSAQLRARKTVVKLHLRFPLHAKLYLLHRRDHNTQTAGFLGSSNLTFSGLVTQGELNVDVPDRTAADELSRWFDARWNDRLSLDITDELATIIDESWARPPEAQPTPYELYLKIAYHLSQEARAGLAEFGIPRDLAGTLFQYQAAAVSIAARYLNRRGGVVLGDVVGLGKTLMATALVKLLEDSHSPALIVCPVNLVPMWQDHVERYGLRARVLPVSRVQGELPNLIRYRLVLIDESHNLRNREGARYRAIREYVAANDAKVILLSATPYNKTYLDLSNQLRLFVPEDADLGVRPEAMLRGLDEFAVARLQVPLQSLQAFEKSGEPDDWRELMRLYLVRRTRSFIQANYAQTDEAGRKYLAYADGRSRSYFPARRPRTAAFAIKDTDPADPYARLYAPEVVAAVNGLALPRYGLGNYVAPRPNSPPTAAEAELLRNLGRAGKRLMGFSRTNLFKRLESGGTTFLQSLERHALRNFVFLHALETAQPLPVGTQDGSLLDARDHDEDADAVLPAGDEDVFGDEEEAQDEAAGLERSEAAYRARAAGLYAGYASAHKKRFKWLSPGLFTRQLADHLRRDARAILGLLARFGRWDAARDAKLGALVTLLAETHKDEKVLVFTQFADTVRYLVAQLQARGVAGVAGATGSSGDVTELAWRFSPRSNDKRYPPGQELRVLVATDVLSEGQNLQDAHVIVNYDLPWAIIRLIQRAGRVDRIGQTAQEILSYSFLPADGVERILNLRARVRQRLRENAEVVGADERFFEDDADDALVVDLYNEKAGLLDGEADDEVDLASYAYQIWKNAADADPALARRVAELPDVVYSSRRHVGHAGSPQGVLVYARTGDGNDSLAWIDKEGRSVTQSQLRILQAAECSPDTPTAPRDPLHHDLVRRGVEHIGSEERSTVGRLGRPSGARYRTYQRLKGYAEHVKGSLFDTPELAHAVDEVYRFPLRQAATDALNRQLKSGVSDEKLAELVLSLRDEGRLCVVDEDDGPKEPKIICSLGLFSGQGGVT